MNYSDYFGNESLSFSITGIKETVDINQISANIRKNEDQITEHHQIILNKANTLSSDLNCIGSISYSDIKGESKDITIVNEIEKNVPSKLKQKKTKRYAVSKMQNGKKYRILIFDQSGNNFITKLDATVGEDAPRWENAKRNTTYKWIAYTFNSEKLPNFPNTPTESDYTLQISAPNGTKFTSLYWDQGTITTANTAHIDNKSTILFQARQTLFQVKISGRALFDKILNFSRKIEGLPLTGDTFDLKSGNYTSKTNSLSHVDFDIQECFSSSNDTVFNLNLYTTFEGNIPANGISLTLNQITFATDAFNKANKSSRTLTRNRYGDPLKFTFNFADDNITLKFGKKANILFDMSPPMILRGGQYYAISNLYFDEINQKYALRHYNTDIYDHPDFNGLNGSKQEYFNWKALRPGLNEVSGKGDPCAFAYPKGFYKMPTQTALTSLTSSAFSNSTNTATVPRKFGTFEVEGSSRIAYFVTHTMSFLPYSNFHAIPYLQLGYRQSGSDSYALRVDNPSEQAAAQLWSDQEFEGNNSNAYYLSISNSNASAPLSVSLQNGAKNQGRQIRCMYNFQYIYEIEL